MTDYTIKPMQADDEIDGKGYVHFKSWHETYSQLVDTEYMNGITEEKCKKIAHRWTDNVLVAKDGNRVIGFIGYGAYRDDTLSDCGEIYAIYVLADYHGKKIGYALMNAAIGKLSGYKKIAVWVLEGNNKAIKFYERYGFRFDGTEQKIMLGAPNTELRMVYERMERADEEDIRKELQCKIYPLNHLQTYKYVVICTSYQGKWVLSRHKKRNTWETQGGHIEKGETPMEAARRELFEESGIRDATLYPVCDYWGYNDRSSSNGMVFLAIAHSLGELPDSEMQETGIFDTIPKELTYPKVSPILYREAEKILKEIMK